jgi:hypothetical protein
LKSGNTAASTSKAVDSISGLPRPFTQCLTENKARQDDERSDSVDSDDSDTSRCNPKAPRFWTLRDDEETPVSACLFSRNPLLSPTTRSRPAARLSCSTARARQLASTTCSCAAPTGLVGPSWSATIVQRLNNWRT